MIGAVCGILAVKISIQSTIKVGVAIGKFAKGRYDYNKMQNKMAKDFEKAKFNQSQTNKDGMNSVIDKHKLFETGNLYKSLTNASLNEEILNANSEIEKVTPIEHDMQSIKDMVFQTSANQREIQEVLIKVLDEISFFQNQIKHQNDMVVNQGDLSQDGTSNHLSPNDQAENDSLKKNKKIKSVKLSMGNNFDKVYVRTENPMINRQHTTLSKKLSITSEV